MPPIASTATSTPPDSASSRPDATTDTAPKLGPTTGHVDAHDQTGSPVRLAASLASSAIACKSERTDSAPPENRSLPSCSVEN